MNTENKTKTKGKREFAVTGDRSTVSHGTTEQRKKMHSIQEVNRYSQALHQGKEGVEAEIKGTVFRNGKSVYMRGNRVGTEVFVET